MSEATEPMVVTAPAEWRSLGPCSAGAIPLRCGICTARVWISAHVIVAITQAAQSMVIRCWTCISPAFDLAAVVYSSRN